MTGETAAIIAATVKWLGVGQRVRPTDAPRTVDPAFGIQRPLGRHGVIWRLRRSVTDHSRVFFDPVGGERTAKIEFAEPRELTPVID